MSQRSSGYTRQANEFYRTPSWVTEAVIPHLPWTGGTVWEPACGDGAMVDVLCQHFSEVVATDADRGETERFHSFKSAGKATAIFGNPPYNQAEEFIIHALELMIPCRGMVAFLLRVDYDSAKTRHYLFANHPAWYKKVVLLKRIVWFAGEKSPSFNHAWYIWNWRHQGPPTIAYAPLENGD